MSPQRILLIYPILSVNGCDSLISFVSFYLIHGQHMADQMKWEFSDLLVKSSLCTTHLVKHGFRDGNGIQLSLGLDPNTENLWTALKRPEFSELNKCFDSSMTGFTNSVAVPVLREVNLGRHEVICDIGGSLGTLLLNILQYYPSIKRGILFDLPDVIENAKAEDLLGKNGIDRKRYEFTAGDFFGSETIPQSNAYIMVSSDIIKAYITIIAAAYASASAYPCYSTLHSTALI
jgi:hypothetical protein